MESLGNYMIAYNFRIIARSLILLLGAVVFTLAFTAGIEDLKGGIDGILMSSKYSVAWLILLAIFFVAWVWELAGGITILTLALYSLYFFVLNNSSFSIAAFALVLTLLLLSFCLLSCWYLSLYEEIE